MDVDTLKDSEKSKSTISKDTKLNPGKQSNKDTDRNEKQKENSGDFSNSSRTEANNGALKNTKTISVVPLERLLAHPEKAEEFKRKIQDTPVKLKENLNRNSRNRSILKCPSKEETKKKTLPVRKSRAQTSIVDLISSTDTSSSDEDTDVEEIVKKINGEKVKESIKSTNKLNNSKTDNISSKVNNTNFKLKRCVVRVKRIRWSPHNTNDKNIVEKKVTTNNESKKNNTKQSSEIISKRPTRLSLTVSTKRSEILNNNSKKSSPPPPVSTLRNTRQRSGIQNNDSKGKSLNTSSISSRSSSTSSRESSKDRINKNEFQSKQRSGIQNNNNKQKSALKSPVSSLTSFRNSRQRSEVPNNDKEDKTIKKKSSVLSCSSSFSSKDSSEPRNNKKSKFSNKEKSPVISGESSGATKEKATKKESPAPSRSSSSSSRDSSKTRDNNKKQKTSITAKSSIVSTTRTRSLSRESSEVTKEEATKKRAKESSKATNKQTNKEKVTNIKPSVPSKSRSRSSSRESFEVCKEKTPREEYPTTSKSRSLSSSREISKATNKKETNRKLSVSSKTRSQSSSSESSEVNKQKIPTKEFPTTSKSRSRSLSKETSEVSKEKVTKKNLSRSSSSESSEASKEKTTKQKSPVPSKTRSRLQSKDISKESTGNEKKKNSSTSSQSSSAGSTSNSDTEGDNNTKNKSEALGKKRKMASTTNASNNKRRRLASDSDSDFDIKEAAENAVNNFSDENDDDEVAGRSGKRSEDDSDSEVVVKTRRKRAATKKKADASDDSDFEPSKPKRSAAGGSKRRRRIKNNDSSDSGSGSEDGKKKKDKSKRKQIHKIIRNEDLNIDTKTATKEEQERRRRIEERQKLYNQIYEKPESAEVSELVLDFDEESKKPLLTVDTGILKKLKPHQVTGVKFMWEACYETIKDAKEKSGSGCILAHCMGLGKTLQVVTLSHTLLVNARKTHVERVLIISPLSTLNNWAREFKHWTSFTRKKDVEIYDMSRYKDKLTRIFKLNEWFREGGVCIMGYDMFRILSNEKAKGLRKKQREQLQEALVDPGPDLVICDEGHLLKNEKTSISKAVTKMRTRRRVVLTGTPLQNNLKEYYCMIQFVKPNLLGTYKEYLNRFVNPITNGQYTDSTERDIRLMKHRSHILHKMLEGCIQRKDYSVLAPYLPPKQEYVVYTQLSEVQKELYEFYMKTQRELISSDITGKGARLFQDFQDLRRIWTHPMNLRVNSDTVIRKRILANDDDSMEDFICDDDDESDDGGDGGKKKGNRKIVDETSDSNDSVDSSKSFPSDAGDDSVGGPSTQRKTRSLRKQNNGDDDGSDDEDSDLETQQATADQDDPSEWWKRFVEEKELNNVNHSPKLVILMRLLQRCETIGDKVLVFSQSLQSLDVIEHFLKLIDRKTRGEEIDGDVGDFKGLWQPNVDYFRLDGSSSVDNRDDMCKRFNNTNNLRARLFLISTRAGGLGINLVAANRVVIFDVSWNPSHDTQSIFRVYRFGQDKPCYIYRLIAMGTMEQKVYERQVIKQATAKRVIDEQQISRHYNSSDLQELYSYELTPTTEREFPILPKDRLFAELLCDFEKLIFKYHEHDSLLENEESENLSEEERKAAWSEYEAEKTRATQAQQYISYDRGAFGNLYGNMGTGGNQTGNVTSSRIFGFRSDILLTLLNLKIAKDCPELNQNQIVQMVPNYLQRLYNEMNNGDPTMYKDLLQIHSTMTPASGMYMSPLLYANQNPQAAGYQQKTTGVAPGQAQSVIVNNAGSTSTEGGAAQTPASGFNSGEVYEID